MIRNKYIIILFSCMSFMRLDAVMYWDADDGNVGAAVGTSASGVWDAILANWNLNPDGSSANQSYASGEDVYFSAGADATGFSSIAVSGSHNVSSLSVEEGIVVLTCGVLNFCDTSPDIDIAAGLTATINSSISGSNGLRLVGVGTVVVGGVNSYTGDTLIDNGTFMSGADNIIPDSSDLILNGGTYDSNGYDETAANLSLNSNSVINLAGGDSVLNFSSMNNNSGTLQIWNWDGIEGQAGGNDRIIFSTYFASGVINNIEFYNDDGNTFIQYGGLYDLGNGSWELVATSVPETSTYVSVGALIAAVLLHRYRRNCVKQNNLTVK